MIDEARLVIDAKATLGEGPCWDEHKQQLYWVDIPEKKLHTFDPYTGESQSIHLEQQIGAAVVRQSGGMVVALEHGLYFLDLTTEELTHIHDPEQHVPTNRFNDGKVDPAGRFWVGTMSLDPKASKGSLYRLNLDASVSTMIEGVSISNGLAWSIDKQTMYYIDTPTKQIVAYDYDEASGDISNKRTVISIEDEGHNPDGMTIDAEGFLWVAEWGGSQVCRWNPNTGAKVASIKLPVSLVTSCTFGGKNLDELYITTARTRLTEEQLQEQPQAGGLFMVKPGVSGTVSQSFKG